jgi:glycerol-3-phosphate cytidylyltransferase
MTSVVSPVPQRSPEEPPCELFPTASSGARLDCQPPLASKPVKVLTYGTFDLFHIGHLRLLERLRGLGDHLTVAVSTDEFNAPKGKSSIIPYADRAALVAACRFVDEVIPEEHWEQKRQDIVRLDIDVFGMGGDWEGRFDELGEVCKVVYLPRTDGISSTALKDRLKVFDNASLESLKAAIETAQNVLSRLS